MLIIVYILLGLAICTMAFSLIQAVRLRQLAMGGHVGKVLKGLLAFIVFFLAAYLAAPLLLTLSPDHAMVLTAVVFLLGALFVAIVIRLIRSLIQQILKELDL